MQPNIRQQEQARDAEQRLDGPKADNALTFKPDHLMGHAMRRSGAILLSWGGRFAAKQSIVTGPPMSSIAPSFKVCVI